MIMLGLFCSIFKSSSSCECHFYWNGLKGGKKSSFQHRLTWDYININKTVCNTDFKRCLNKSVKEMPAILKPTLWS